MANTLLTPVQILRESLRVLHNNTVYIKGINKQYSSEFGQTGAKIGATVNVRKPNQYFVRKGPVAQAQATTETYVPLTLNTQYGVDVAFTTAELSLSLDDFSKRIIAPQMARIASQMDYDALQCGTLGYYTANNGVVVKTATPVYNCVGTAGTTPGTSGGSGILQSTAPIVYLNAGMMLDNNACPRDENRRVILNPAAHAQSVSGLSGLFNDQSALSEQYRKGVLGNALGFEFAMDQNVPVLSYSGTRVAGTASADLTSGATSVAVTGCGNNITIKAGEVFTIAGVYAVNPENQQSTGQLYQFVVTADTLLNGSGAGTLPIGNPPVVIGATVANGTVTTLTASGQSIAWITGLSAGSVVNNIAYHQDFMTLATADLEIPGGVDFSARESYDGISMRLVRAYDINNDQLILSLIHI